MHKKLTNKGFTLYAYKVSEWKHFYNKYCPRKGVIFEKGSSPKAWSEILKYSTELDLYATMHAVNRFSWQGKSN